MYRLLCAIFFGCIYKVRTNRRTTGISTSAPCFIIRRPTPKFYKKKKFGPYSLNTDRISQYMTVRSNSSQFILKQVCTNQGCQVAGGGLNRVWWRLISVGPYVLNLLRATLLANRILKWLLHFWNILNNSKPSPKKLSLKKKMRM